MHKAPTSKKINSFLNKSKNFPPPKYIQKNSWIKTTEIYKKANKDPESFWAEAAQHLEWFKPWSKILEWNLPDSRWFINGKINASYNCLDKHLKEGHQDKVAIFWEGEPGDRRILTYKELHKEVCRISNVLKNMGLKKGDNVTIYLPMVPELPIAMLACSRLGVVHSVVFAGYSSKALVDRIRSSDAKLVITANHGFRRGKIIPLKQNVDQALKTADNVKNVIVYKRSDVPSTMLKGRDFWWHELVMNESPTCDPVPLDSEDPLFILYTSGTTGKPKGVVHVNGGYLVGVKITQKWIFDIKDQDIYWCTADIGWITGHSYIVYGPLLNRATQIMYEGAPDYPQPDRFWDIVERYKVTILYTAPTAVRAFMKWGEKWPNKHNLKSLRILGSVGEPINPQAWIWYHNNIGLGKCPIIDTWWQTETGSILITPLPGVTTLKPGSATFPFPGIDVDVVDETGKPVPPEKSGYLVIKKPWPSMLKTLYKDPKRYKQTYWIQIPGVYFTGDSARKDKDGYFWILGRVDDDMKVSGHRLGTMEIESAISNHPLVVEAAVVGKPHEIKGQSITAYVTLLDHVIPTEDLKNEIRNQVRKDIGPFASPDTICFVKNLPKTRSGKIMRRIMRALISGQEIGDITTLENPSVVNEVKKWLDTTNNLC